MTLLEYLYGHPARAVPQLCLAFSVALGFLSGSATVALVSALVTLGGWRVASAFLVIEDQRNGPVRLRCPDDRVWLTFDDGPGPETLDIVRTLNEFGWPATFFFIGDQVTGYPQLVELRQALAQGGHKVANHSLNHPNFLWLSRRQTRHEIETTQTLLGEAFAEQVLPIFRPPFGYRKVSTIEEANRLGLETVGWSVNSLDFLNGERIRLLDRVKDSVRPGSIVLFHDGRDQRQLTLSVLAPLLKWMKAQGYQAYNPDL